jgi:hypothetical protein
MIRVLVWDVDVDDMSPGGWLRSKVELCDGVGTNFDETIHQRQPAYLVTIVGEKAKTDAARKMLYHEVAERGGMCKLK